MAKHLVWDWNGTLLDDFEAVVAASSAAVVALGGTAFDGATHREKYRRPITDFYNEQLGRELTEAEFERLNELFHSGYLERIAECRLAEGALEAVTGWNGTQSLLSMWRHADLVPLVTRFGLAEHFARVDGLRATDHGGKHRYLVAHLSELNVQATEVVMIGDSVDDADAAVAAGAGCVLYSGGTTSERLLRATGFPVVDTLAEAVETARLG
ncbi:phosphoglycolate phosphatase-like HAD superfamily hydrolase [Stackebrandtia albiflava]|uniref:Phosphoglycolate phosphatase-like HAD superfamily hydrolase n=1 Tax=Stackebrandtia albiflava TaxID=406432 RepID=A0A562UYM9_9ACTN|nr:HAD family hydrolase [Stackebrandtia albiflava]TWJ10715.1 phosphoglycolate phosphatase-like HAD superfamily hydrolase [Stackebrandtia albiflava]